MVSVFIIDLPDYSVEYGLWNKRWIIFSVWFRKESDYYKFMSSSHVSPPFGTYSFRPCSCVLWNHQVRTIIDIALSFHHFHPGYLFSSTDWANIPTRILVLLGEHGWGDSNSRIIVFPQQHLTHRERSHGATPCPLEWQSPFRTCWTPSLRTGSPQPEDLKISFLWRACLFVGKVNHLPETPPSPLECLCEGPKFPVVTPLLLTHVSRRPKCQ